MRSSGFNGTRLTPHEWVRYCSSDAGVDLLEASFEHHVYERHIHDTYAIGVTGRGVQRFWCRGSTHDSRPDDIIVIPPGEAHDGQAGTAGGYAYRMFYVSISRMTELACDAFDRPESSLQLRQSCLLREPALARDLTHAWKVTISQPHSLAADALFRRALVRLDVRHCDNDERRRVVDHVALKRVRDYLRDHVHHHVKLGDLAAMASMSRFQLTRQFEKAYGLPLHAYHVHLKLVEAKKRLRIGIPIATVAADLGFADQSHLHRRFKGAFGMTPGQWRGMNRASFMDETARASKTI